MSSNTGSANSGDDAAAGTWGKTACILCECNCGLEVLVKDGALLKIRGDKDHPGSAGYSCEKPLRLDRYQSNPYRLTSPLKRMPDGEYVEIDWGTAFDEIAERLANVRDQFGGDKIFFYGGGGQGNHLGGAYGRGLFHALGAQHMSNALAQEKTGEGWVDRQLYGSHTSGDFENTEVAIFIGKNPWQSHGVARARPTLKELARDPARSIVVIDPRKSETAALADHHLQLRPGTDAWCVAALVATIVQEDLHDDAWLEAHTTGSENVLAALREVDIPTYAHRCGVAEDEIRAAARRIAAASSVATYEDLGVQQSPNSTLVAYLEKMLWMLTGSFAKPGGVHIHSWMIPLVGTWYPVPPERGPRLLALRRLIGLQAMKRGAPAIRALHGRVAGSTKMQSVAESVSQLGLRLFFDAVAESAAAPIARVLGRSDVNGTTPVTGARIFSGLTPCNAIADEVLTDHPDRLRAMWVDASNPVHSLADSGKFAEAMRAVEVSVVIDVAMTETAMQADYVLPAASQFEKYEASMFTLHFPHNTFQMRSPLTAPLPGTKSEPEMYAEIIDRLGVVDDALITRLAAAARAGRASYALALFSSLQENPELRGVAPYLVYRTLGPTFGDGHEAIALVWSLAYLAAIAQPDAVRRAGFSGEGFELCENLFEVIRSTPAGVMFTDDRYEDAWKYIQNADGKIHMNIPELLDELVAVGATDPNYTTEEFPLILSAGERRSFTANVIIRDPQWRRRDFDGALRISEADATDLGIESGDTVRLVTETGSASCIVEVSDMMQTGHISLPNGMGVNFPDGNSTSVVGVALNTLTSTDRRDRFFGSPWHKTVPARVERVEAIEGVTTDVR